MKTKTDRLGRIHQKAYKLNHQVIGSTVYACTHLYGMCSRVLLSRYFFARPKSMIYTWTQKKQTLSITLSKGSKARNDTLLQCLPMPIRKLSTQAKSCSIQSKIKSTHTQLKQVLYAHSYLYCVLLNKNRIWKFLMKLKSSLAPKGHLRYKTI